MTRKRTIKKNKTQPKSRQSRRKMRVKNNATTNKRLHKNQTLCQRGGGLLSFLGLESSGASTASTASTPPPKPSIYNFEKFASEHGVTVMVDRTNDKWLVCDDYINHRDSNSKCFEFMKKIILFNKKSHETPIKIEYLNPETMKGIILNNSDFQRLFNSSDLRLSNLLPEIHKTHQKTLFTNSEEAVHATEQLPSLDLGSSIDSSIALDSSIAPDSSIALEPESLSPPEPNDIIYLKQYEYTGNNITYANLKDVAIAIEYEMYENALRNGLTIGQATRNDKIAEWEKKIQNYMAFIATTEGEKYAQFVYQDFLKKKAAEDAAQKLVAQKAAEEAAKKAAEQKAAEQKAAAQKAAAQKQPDAAAAPKFNKILLHKKH